MNVEDFDGVFETAVKSDIEGREMRERKARKSTAHLFAGRLKAIECGAICRSQWSTMG